MSTIRWLHISDLHLNTPGAASSFLRDELPIFLRRSGIHCDYIFCTGDLRDAREGTFPDDDCKFLKDLVSAVGATDLFIVPGNHDVNRGLETEARHQTVQRIRSSYRSDVGIIDAANLEVLHAAQADFREYISNLLSVSRMKCYSSPHFNVETEHFNILHVDSTLTYSIGSESNLIIGTDLLYKALKTINKSKPTILLTHYAYTMLAQEERKMVGEMLYHNGIQLWLAGHEHEHNLQPVKYLHSIQSGELRLEDRCNTSVLVGELDTDTMSGRIRAYAWFKEGWYLYPAIWHGTFGTPGMTGSGGRDGKDDEYPFVLRLQEDGQIRSLEAINSHKHNQKYKRSYDFVDDLFADIEKDGIEYRRNTIDCLADAWEKGQHLILLADGGMGKTTRLLFTCDEMKDASVLYFPLESVETGNLIRDICRALFSDSNEERLYSYAKERHTNPDAYLFLDGMNEVNADQEREIVAVVKKIARDYPGIQMVISSRSNFAERYRLEGFSIARIKPLREEQIKTLFDGTEWRKIEANPPLKKLIQNPLMATLYKRISPEIGKENILWIEDISNETELLYDYYMTQIALGVERDINIAQYIQRCLPFIAYCFEHQSKHAMPRSEFDVVIEKAVALSRDPSIERFQRAYRVSAIDSITAFSLEDYLFNISHLLCEIEGSISFPHQIHRDYLSAVWMTKAEDLFAAWNERFFTTTISNHIRILSGEGYWNRLASAVTNLARNRDDSRNLIINVINTFPYDEKSGLADFSDLNLRGIRIPDYEYNNEKIRLTSAIIDAYSIGCESEEVILLKSLSFSPDNSCLAGVTDNALIIYSMDTGLKVYRDEKQFGNCAIQFSCDSRYLFIKQNQNLSIYEIDGNGWKYIGTILGVYVKKLHNAIIHNGMLTFYFNNRVSSYSLADVGEIENYQSDHPYENIAEGEDIAKIEQSGSPRDEMELAVAVSADSQYRAVSFQDGRLDVTYYGGKILHHLEIGKAVLLSAAISKDGNRAATLSANTYGGKRRMQLWNLDNRQKVDERFCNADINKLFLTDHGDWIVGSNGFKSWFWNWSDAQRCFTKGERFISESDYGLTTYGNCLLYQSGEGNLHELDLDDNSDSVVGTFSPIHYATVLPSGTVAIVGHSRRNVVFRSTTTNRELQINSEQTRIRYVHAFKTQPFIAVLTENGRMSIYHVGTGQRTRKINSSVGYRIVAFHPDQNVFSFSDGKRRLETLRYFEWDTEWGKRIGNWYGPEHPKFTVAGKIIAIGFNPQQEEQIMIETNGQITFMKDRFCDFHSQTKVITNFSVANYDFRGVKCDKDTWEQLLRNGVSFAVKSLEEP